MKMLVASKSSLLKLQYLQNITEWSSEDDATALDHYGAAIFSTRFAAYGEVIGLSLNDFLFTCERYISILYTCIWSLWLLFNLG